MKTDWLSRVKGVEKMSKVSNYSMSYNRVLRAVAITKSLGARVAAGYCRNRGISLAVALYVIAGSKREIV